MDRHNQSLQRGRSVSAANAAQANEYFEHFLNANTLKSILGYYRSICDLLHLKPNVFPLFYPKLRANLTSWRAKALWKKFDARASHKCYAKGKACPNTRVLIIGAGPCGLRSAIEAQLLGAKVVVVEKRDRISRNNVLHLWPFVIEDLRALGAKKFFGKFCAGAIDHISIRMLQCILLKVALLLGVEVHTEISFERLIEPNITTKNGWRAEFKPQDHPVNQYEFDVIIGADGKRNTLQGFKRKEFRGKLAIAITANFINRRTEAEARVEEISGVAFIFNQKFFKDLYAETGIDLENIVYYKDDTHYFVMTAKKASLIDKGVIKQDLADTEQLLAPDNVDREALMNYAREAAEFSTNYQMPNLEFAVNHYAQPDVAMFDFTSMYAADNASKVIERNGYRLLMILVGDSLLEPFWPTGSGCARGFLSSLDACWAIRAWGSETVTPLEVLAERESIYRLLAQTTPDNLNKEWKAYTLDPATRYPNLNKNAVIAHQVVSLFDTDNPKSIEHMKRTSQEAAQSIGPKRRKRDIVDNEVLLRWVEEQIKDHEDLEVSDIASVFKDGRILCAILSHYRPDLLDYNALVKDEPAKNNQTAIDIFEKEIGLSPLMTGEEMTKTEDLLSLSLYLTEIYHTFRCEIPHINHPKLVSEAKALAPEQNDKMKISKPKKNPLPSPYPPELLKKKSVLSEMKLPPKPELNEKFEIGNSTIPNSSVSETLNEVKLIDHKEKAASSKFNSMPIPSSNELLLKKSMLKPVFRNETPKVSNTRTPFDFWIKQNEMLVNDCLNDRVSVLDDFSCKEESELKFFDENFREVSPDLLKTSVAGIAVSSTITEHDFSVVVSKTSKSSDDKTPNTILWKNPEYDLNMKSSLNLTPESSSSEDVQIKIRLIKQNSYNKQLTQTLSFNFKQNALYVLPNKCSQIEEHYVPRCLREGNYQEGFTLFSRNICHTSNNLPFLNVHQFKFLFKANMSDHHLSVPPEQIYERVVEWLNNSDTKKCEADRAKSIVDTGCETNIPGNLSDISSITKVINRQRHRRQELERINEIPKTISEKTVLTQDSSDARLQAVVEKLKNSAVVNSLKKITNLSSLQLYKKRVNTKPKPPSIPPILENEEVELPEDKRTETAFGKQMYAHMFFRKPAASAPPAQPPRPSSRHKRHADTMASNKPPSSLERKPRKRRTLERVGASVEDRQKRLEEIVANRTDRQNKRRQHRKYQTEQFIKSMQMLQANAKPDASGPFEDYSIFLYRQTAPNFEDRVKDLEKKFIYVPEQEARLPASTRAEKDEDFAARIKDMEEKWREPVVAEKKPKDLLRAIGKIETSDWNIKEIEKKINENKMGKSVNKDKEKVPKWSREQFLARQTKMEKQHLDRQDSAEAKFADIDKSIKHLEMKLKEGTSRDLGQNKVASITEKLVPKGAEVESKPVQRSNSRTFVPAGGSEICHFCSKRVYLMERLSAEGRFFHHGCFRCQYCHTQLRLGSYAFDKDGQYGHKFFCVHHYGLQGELRPATKIIKKVSSRAPRETKSPEKKLSGVTGVDLLDRVQTPERIEFANLSAGNISSEHDEPPSQMDEDEWTDRNFGASAAELGSSEDESSSLSDTDSDDEDAYEEALEEPATKEGTLKWAERLSRRYRRKNSNESDSDDYSSSDHSSYYENTTDDDDSDTATEGEEEIRARELRKQEVRVEPPLVYTDTGTDTEVVSDESTSDSSSEIQNSATEISTDSEFAHDDPTPTREVPSIVLNDFHVTKSRGTYRTPKKIQVTSGYLQSPIGSKQPQKQDIELKLKPLVPSTPIIRTAAPLLPRTEGYALNRTQSTGGIAAKVSLELKKKYLLGESSTGGSIQKSGSASTLDSKFKSFRTNISDCQKLLKPAPEISASMQTFCNKLDERLSPVLSPTVNKSVFGGDEKEKKVTDSVVISKPLPPPDVTKEADSDQRPRSPLHETSIIVPQIDWNKNKSSESSDSSSSESDSIENEKLEKSPSVLFENIPRVEIHDTTGEIVKDDMALDSLCVVEEQTQNEIPKSINGEKKSLNQPKFLPELEKSSVLPEEHDTLHTKQKADTPEEQKVSSGRSTPSNDSCVEQATAALTETELSDWAHDDFEDPDFELTNSKKDKNLIKGVPTIAELGEFDEISQISTKQKRVKDPKSITEAFNNVLSPNLENIEFMDTGTETSSDDGVGETNNGYMQLKNEEEMAEDSLSPQVNGIVEAANFNVINSEDNKFGSECIDLKPADLEKMKQNHNYENEDDSLLIVEPGTTTEENTCSDSTVKNVTEKLPENIDAAKVTDNNNAALQKEKKSTTTTPEDNITYEEHCHRLMSKVEFGNVKDSIDIRKSRRKSKSESPPKPDLIQEEKERLSPITLQLTPTVRTPNLLYKKEEIEKERDLNQKLVQEMVMNKMKLQNKSLERKKRNRNVFSPVSSPNKPFDLSKSATIDITPQISNKSNESSPYSTSSSVYATPDVILPAKLTPLQKSQTTTTIVPQKTPNDSPADIYSTPIAKELRPMRPLSVFSSYIERSQRTNPDAFSLPDIKKAVKEEDLKTPVAPPRYKHEEAKRTVEKMKQNARARCRLLSNEELGLSPEDKLQKLREKVMKQEKENRVDNIDVHIQDSIESLVLNTERRNSLLYSNDTLKKKRSKNGDDATVEKKLELLEQKCSKPTRTKSVSELAKKSELKLLESPVMEDKNFLHKSEPILLPDTKKSKKKGKDLERRKSITKLFSTLFTKKKDSNSKGFLSRLSPKYKDKSKDVAVEEPVRRRSLTEFTSYVSDGNASPPPIPPLPSNYSVDKSVKDDSSDGEKNRSSCDTLDKSGTLDGSLSSLGSKKLKGARKAVRQAQLKRHRMAQEIQRKLEETEVKTKELEERGVLIEKALRGEVSEGYCKEETELLQEFFDLMRERTELRRYERELLVRAQELELEDRHARLQQELRERLENDEQKTKESLEIESSIIKEMMDIVAKRDSLIALLEEDRLRYSEEDRDFEEKMLAKGLKLTPIKKTSDK